MAYSIIYKAENRLTGEVYIGASTKSLEERKQDHLQKAEKKVGSYFQEAIATYSPEAFTWEQIDTANNNNELAQKETKYIFKYNSVKNGYNCDRGGGIKKEVYQYNLEGKLIKTFESLKIIKDNLGLGKQRISNACINSTMYSDSFWSYELVENFSPKKDLRKKSVSQFSLDEKFIENFKSASEASRITGISKTCITRCCRGEREQTGGFLWKYI
ncbi:NUMOD1 domain-containing DNA-binding protein [Flavobacterium sp. AJR]|uniref:NUMOD1 domain-containing DNA-binding protein n=1 Tax=Flavobacterium sp. AJR TaxID=1979369 RepID=UPI000A3D63D5|nr:NUMOD1 domain-containing DNA-binding protein [Flavobacterium sp. AJR]OUL60981.1 endonuclease [Flavobacterium sp. AJR]